MAENIDWGIMGERENVKVYSSVLFVLTLLIAVATLLFLHYLMRRRARLDEIARRATEESAFSPTVFRIYDRSTRRVCDRLIRVMPFDWWIWACRNELYILNPEGGIKCSAGSTPAVQVLATQFVEVCLNLNYDSLLSGYTTLPCKIVPYEIESTTFTILSALNLLAERWITFDASGEDRRVPRLARIADEDGTSGRADEAGTSGRADEAGTSGRADEAGTSGRARRAVSASELERRTARFSAVDSASSSHTRLLERARAVAERRRARLGATSNATVTGYQHTDEYDALSRVYVRTPVTSS